MEAQRVLSRLGFVCRRAGHDSDGLAAWVADIDSLDPGRSFDQRLSVLEATIAGLHARVNTLELEGRVLDE